MPARRPGARPPARGWIGLTSSPARASSHEMSSWSSTSRRHRAGRAPNRRRHLRHDRARVALVRGPRSAAAGSPPLPQCPRGLRAGGAPRAPSGRDRSGHGARARQRSPRRRGRSDAPSGRRRRGAASTGRLRSSSGRAAVLVSDAHGAATISMRVGAPRRRFSTTVPVYARPGVLSSCRDRRSQGRRAPGSVR